MCSWLQSLGVSWEHGCLANVVESAEELNDTFHAKTSASMSRCAILECVDVVLDGLDGDSHRLGSLSEHGRVVHSLGTGCDLLTAHEEVIGVGVAGVVGVKHRVERSGGDGVTVQHVEVSVVFSFHERA